MDLVMTSDIPVRSGLHYCRCLILRCYPEATPGVSVSYSEADAVTPWRSGSRKRLPIYPVQRVAPWIFCGAPLRSRRGISPQLKSVDNTLLFDPDGGCPDGHRRAAALRWKVERQVAWWSPKPGEVMVCYAAVRDGEQRQPVTEAFICSARNHACDHLSLVRECGAGLPRRWTQ